jgi:gamma-glutamyl phosphate reductase
MSQQQAEIQRESEAFGEAEQRDAAATLRNASPEERKQRLEAAMNEHLEATTEEIMTESDDDAGRPR